MSARTAFGRFFALSASTDQARRLFVPIRVVSA
ncbi:hypothetical protein MBUL_00940 [Methylobacterium bullatum]|uniref:Uncharacterized protein n=1 Tax=Methylobacterium bullatum TaxID=570505 RepID=A0A679J409_9HYPH|nr:hypothetical protein MBUL_00940 [Methylobacterium bullatum]